MTTQEKKRQLTITFYSEEEKDYVVLIARRKGYNLAQYIVDNFEWDDRLECEDVVNPKKITKGICEGCEFGISGSCPDRVGAP
jgi:hypothetical protein